MIFPFPRWLLNMPEGVKKQRAIDEFYLRLACVYASRGARIHVLAEILGINYTTLRSQINDSRCHKNGIPETTYQKIEKIIGLSYVAGEKTRLYG
jgi:hypothetical protein